MPPFPIHSPAAPPAIGPYAHAVVSRGLVFLSGQLPLDPATMEIVDGGPAAQLRMALANAEAILLTCRASLADVVKTTVFVTDLSAFGAINEAYAQAFGTHKPARSVVEVSALPRGASVEVELVAEVNTNG